MSTPPVIILVEPQLGENIGACARAMMNCGLEQLRLVAPRDGWPNPAAHAMAAGADRILEAAEVYPTTQAAVDDLHWIAATTARLRDMPKPEINPRQAAAEIHARTHQGQKVGVLFGRERSGLTNDDVGLANSLLHIPLNPEHMSLNLAQAVLLVGYEWYCALEPTDDATAIETALPARLETLQALNDRLIAALDQTNFLTLEHKRPRMIRNIRNVMLRLELSEQEVAIFHGMLSALTRGDKP